MQAQRTAYIDDGLKLRSEIEAEALALGFADCGVAAPEAVVEAGRRLRRAVSDGHHGEMAWMEDRIDWRA
ncbi:MAG: epoxyqueuosine reductase, partial [Pseudomonadota bacterium]